MKLIGMSMKHLDVTFTYRSREAGLQKNTMSAAVRERTTTHTSRKMVSHGGPISGQRDGAATASSLENNLGKPLNVPPEMRNPIYPFFSFLATRGYMALFIRALLVFASLVK